jgi:hypothetical protein
MITVQLLCIIHFDRRVGPSYIEGRHADIVSTPETKNSTIRSYHAKQKPVEKARLGDHQNRAPKCLNVHYTSISYIYQHPKISTLFQNLVLAHTQSQSKATPISTERGFERRYQGDSNRGHSGSSTTPRPKSGLADYTSSSFKISQAMPTGKDIPQISSSYHDEHIVWEAQRRDSAFFTVNNSHLTN